MANSQRGVLDDFLQQIFIFQVMVWIDYEMAHHDRTVKHTSKEPF